MTLTGSNSYGPTTISEYGTLQVGDGGTTGCLGAGAVTDNATLSYDRSDDVTIDYAISGTGSVAQDGSGTLTLSGANGYSGGTEIDNGNLAFGGTGSIPSGTGSIIVSSGGGLNVPGPYNHVTDWLSMIDPASDGALAITADNSETINMTGHDYLSLGAAANCQFTGTLSNPDNNTSIFGGGGGTLTLPNPLGDVLGDSTNVVIQGNVNFAAANTYTGTTTIAPVRSS